MTAGARTVKWTALVVLSLIALMLSSSVIASALIDRPVTYSAFTQANKRRIRSLKRLMPAHRLRDL